MSSRIQQIGDPKYNCPFCVIVKRDPPWNPANSGKVLKDQLTYTLILLLPST